MSRTRFLIKPDAWNKLISNLTSVYGLPEINLSLILYCRQGTQIFELVFVNNTCSFRSYNKQDDSDHRHIDHFKSTPPIRIENKNIKFLLKIITQLGFTKAQIGEATRIDFKQNDQLVVSLKLGSLIGNIATVHGEIPELHLIRECAEREINPEDIDEMVRERQHPEEEIINHLGIVNSRIQNYANRFCLDLSSGVSSIALKLGAKSNDYSVYEEQYNVILGHDLSSLAPTPYQEHFFKPMSIIMPSYNSEATVVKTLYSIQSQGLTSQQKAALDVIVIDDGSVQRLNDALAPHLANFEFKPRVIRLENNCGISAARNTGLSYSIYDKVLFIDSDILLMSNYLYEVSIRLQVIPVAACFSLKENIEPTVELAQIERIRQGLPIARNYADKRLFRTFDREDPGTYDVHTSGIFEILNETNSLKNFGNGRCINGYDLPSAVIGHNLGVRKTMARAAGGFSEEFVGWGMEDAYFGAKVISNGNFIIPMLNTGVYHIDHPPRAGSPEAQREACLKNISKYNELIHREI